jgi:hypothetical protein
MSSLSISSETRASTTSRTLAPASVTASGSVTHAGAEVATIAAAPHHGLSLSLPPRGCRRPRPGLKNGLGIAAGNANETRTEVVSVSGQTCR